MKLLPQAQKVISSLKAGRQPAKNTPKWIIEGLEQCGMICWGKPNNYPYNGYCLVENKAETP
jgi:hypothetical protein